jgi:TolB-like protein
MRFMVRRLAIGLLLAFSSWTALGQGRPARIAILPFAAVNASRADSEAITAIFETALIRTGDFQVIEQRRIAEILEIQEFSLSDCSSEECAVKVGQLLSAEQIILGTLAFIGGKHVLNARIVDVARGVSLRADAVETASLADMTRRAAVLAYRLAGRAYPEGDPAEPAAGFADLFVETEPAGAEILINGVASGVSPVLLSKVPSGFVRVEARQGNLYAAEEVRLARSAVRMSLRLTEQLGSVYVRTSPIALEAVLDGKALGPLGGGLIERLPVGRHRLELRGEGLYWANEVTIRLGEITQVEAAPQPVGSINYRFPPGVNATISGESFREVVETSGLLADLRPGRYTVQTASDSHEPFTGEILVEQGKVAFLEPTLQFTREYQQQLFGQQRREQLASLSAQRASIQQNLASLERKRRTSLRGQWACFGTGLACLGTAGVFLPFAGEAYQSYLQAPTTSEAIRWRQEVTRWKTGIYVGASLGGALLGGSWLFRRIRRDVRQYQAELAEVNRRIQDLETQTE